MSNTSSDEIVSKKISAKIPSYIILFLAIIALFINHQYFFYGHFGYDDMHYARLASNSLQGIFDWTDHYNYRLTLVLTTALSYMLFGINDFASMLPALILSSSILGCFFLVFKKSPILLLLSILLYFSFQWNLFYSDKLVPDIYVTTFCLFAWLLYEKGKTLNNISIPILSAICLFVAFNAKGTVIVFIPLFSYLLVSDLYKKQFSFWRMFLLSLLTLMFLYFTFFFIVTDNPLSRIIAINENHYINPCSYSEQGSTAIRKRLSIDFYNYLINNQFYIFLLIALIPIISYFKNRKGLLFNNTIIILILLLSVNFMPMTLSPYNPFCLEPRHSTVITPILVICSVRIIRTHLPFYSNNYMKVILLLIASYLVWPTLKYAQYCSTLNYSKYKNDFESVINNPSLEGDIYGSKVFKNMGDYYTKFQHDHPIKFKEFKELQCHDEVLICRNWYSEWHAGLSDEKVKNILNEAKCQSLHEVVYSSPLKDFWIYKTIQSD